MSVAKCVYCGSEIKRSSDFRLVLGWAKGTSLASIACGQPRKPWVWACAFCVEARKRGRAGQESLIP